VAVETGIRGSKTAKWLQRIGATCSQGDPARAVRGTGSTRSCKLRTGAPGVLSRCKRWQLVQGGLGAEEAPFSQCSPEAFRERMVTHNLDRKLLDRWGRPRRQKKGTVGWQS